MSWLKVLDFTPAPVPEKKPRPVGRVPRKIVIRGIEYPSITAARLATGYSTMRLYYLIGEGGRNRKYMKAYNEKNKREKGR